MRAILGRTNRPDSSYILVLRGLNHLAIKYFHYHVKKYPTWGCLVFPEIGELLTSPDITESTSIHKVFVSVEYAHVSDVTLIKWVKEAFPPFEDDDPEIGRDQLLMDAIKGSSEAIKDLEKSISRGTRRIIDCMNGFENTDFML